MADDNFDRPHHHFTTSDFYEYFDHRNIDNCCCHGDDGCTDVDVYYVLTVDDYRELVAAARDRHPTNHQPSSPDPASRAYDSACPICDRTRHRST